MLVDNNELEKEFEYSLEKEIEFNLEKEKLEQVLGEINDEMLRFIEKRKLITEYILDYREKQLEEYRDDEDKLIEYFDHERFVKEEAFKTVDRKIKELNVLAKAPYFGRVDFKEEEFDEEKIYIGRFGLTPEGSYEPVIVDWRAPVSALFYTSSLGESSYRAPAGKIDVDILKKRQYIIKKAKLSGMFDSALDVKDDILQMVLSKSANDKLRDIIMTIQEEQDRIIREPREKTVVVNGVAGSGKTTIALHRVAYLLYNYRETLQDKVLILGPNSIFMEYISTVLPSLGEVGVKQTTFTDLALEIIGLKGVMNISDYMERILSGDKKFIEDVLHKTSEDYLEELNDLVNKLDQEYFNISEVKFFDKVVQSEDDLKDLFYNYYKDMPLFRRSKKVKRIIYSKLRDFRDEEVRKIQKEYKDAVAKLSKTELEVEEGHLNYIRKLKIREAIEEVMRAKRELTWLDSNNVLAIYNKFNSEKELTIDDLAPILYLKVKLEGLKLDREIKHVVIDEAQDYSPIQFIAVKELTKCSSMTVVGDSNQRLIPLKGEAAMLKLNNYLPSMKVEHYNLYKSYRSTREIMEYANGYLKEESIVPLVRNGEPVREHKAKDIEELANILEETIEELNEKGYESIAVICRDMDETERIGKAIRNKNYIKILDNEDIIYNSGSVVIPSYFAKGLEFDAVLLVEPSNELKDNKLLYVMATRALHELHVFKL